MQYVAVLLFLVVIWASHLIFLRMILVKAQITSPFGIDDLHSNSVLTNGAEWLIVADYPVLQGFRWREQEEKKQRWNKKN